MSKHKNELWYWAIKNKKSYTSHILYALIFPNKKYNY